jgi:hypothetical protein
MTWNRYLIFKLCRPPKVILCLYFKKRLCQLAYKLETGEIVNKLFKPPLPIAIEPMSIHHITNEMVADKPAFKGSSDYQKWVDLLNIECLGCLKTRGDALKICKKLGGDNACNNKSLF